MRMCHNVALAPPHATGPPGQAFAHAAPKARVLAFTVKRSLTDRGFWAALHLCRRAEDGRPDAPFEVCALPRGGPRGRGPGRAREPAPAQQRPGLLHRGRGRGRGRSRSRACAGARGAARERPGAPFRGGSRALTQQQRAQQPGARQGRSRHGTQPPTPAPAHSPLPGA
jgi:hypothetical protein